MVKYLFLIAVYGFSIVGFANTNTKTKLSQKQMVELLLFKSSRGKELSLSAELSRSTYLNALSAYDWGMSIEAGKETNKFENFAGTGPLEETINRSALTLRKPFVTGTLLTLEYGQTTTGHEYPPSSTSVSAQRTQNVVGLLLEQNLWRNFFGRADRATTRAAESVYQASLITKNIDQQNLALEGVRLFWQAYIAQETFREALSARDRYNKLVEVVKKKNSFGYSSPGELAQIQAEFETRIQTVKSESTNYLQIMDQLITTLGLQPGTEVEFEIPEEVPALPPLPEVQVERLRKIQTQKLTTQAAFDNYINATSKNNPDLSLIGRVYSSGFENNPADSLSEMNSGAHPKYYVGLRFQATFGSGSQSEEERSRKAQWEIEQSKMDRLNLETRDNLENTKRRVQSTYTIALSTKKQKEFREKAAQELQRSYTQGRTDISVMIEALNKYFANQIAYAKAVGDYQIAINEWAALRDQLIYEQNTKGTNL